LPRFFFDFFVGGFSASLAGFSGGFENQDAAVFQMDFGCLPCLALVESFWIRIGWIPGTVEPKIRSSNEDFHRKGAEVAEGTLRRVCVLGYCRAFFMAIPFHPLGVPSSSIGFPTFLSSRMQGSAFLCDRPCHS
jgi:hypothetical protein